MSRRKPPRRLGVESLELRANPATYAVTSIDDVVNPADDATNFTLREAVDAANNATNPGLITDGRHRILFSPTIAAGSQITLTSGELLLNPWNGEISIIGLGRDRLTISGNNTSRIFNIAAGVNADVSGLTLADGLATSGGAILNNGTLSISDSVFNSNRSTLYGGGILNEATLHLTNTMFSGNSSAFGGGLFNGGVGSAMVNTSTFAENFASNDGGGIYNMHSLSLTNSTLSGNGANGFGGGIASQTNITTLNTTITRNQADANENLAGTGGGIHSYGGASLLTNTIIAGNLSGSAPDDLTGNGAAPTSRNNLVGNAAAAGGLVDGSNGNIVGNAGSGTLDITAILDVNLIDNGGNTPTHALVPGGLAIDSGSNVDAASLGTDQRGLPRVFFLGATVDIGAVESDNGAVESHKVAGAFVVDTSTDNFDSNFSAGQFSLREAVLLANEHAGADLVTFANGITNVTLTAGQLLLADPSQTTIDGGGVIVERIDDFTLPLPADCPRPGDPAEKPANFEYPKERCLGPLFRVLKISNGAAANVNELTIRNGNVERTDSSPGDIGGGILNDGTLAVFDSSILYNRGANGGGIANRGTLTVANSKISNFSTFDGGGIANYGDLTVTNSTLSENGTGLVSEGKGGSIFNAGMATMTNSIVAKNTVYQGDGGGIYNTGIVTITNSIVAENEVNDYDGGGIYNADNATVTIINSTFYKNRAWANGSAIANAGQLARLSVVNSTIAYNSTFVGYSVGGAIWTRDLGGSTTTLNNTLVVENYTVPLPGHLDSEYHNDIAGQSLDPASAHNMIADAGSAGGLVHNQNGNLVGNAGVGTMPVGSILADAFPSDHGGPTFTLALVSGSPAIDAGSDAHIPGDVTTDQRGFSRISGPSVDIGAFEFQKSIASFSLTSNTSTPIPGQIISFTANLTDTILPTGTFSLLVDGFTIGTVNLLNGQATVSVDNLTVGLHAIQALYSGDVNHASSSSAILNQRVYDPADVSRDGVVDIGDILIEVYYFNTYPSAPPIAVSNLPVGPPFADATGDGFFDITDLLLVVYAFNLANANPEGEAISFASERSLVPALSSSTTTPEFDPATTVIALADELTSWLLGELFVNKRRR